MNGLSAATSATELSNLFTVVAQLLGWAARGGRAGAIVDGALPSVIDPETHRWWKTAWLATTNWCDKAAADTAFGLPPTQRLAREVGDVAEGGTRWASPETDFGLPTT